LLECPICNGGGCDECDDGNFRLEQCGRNYIGSEILQAINLAAMADRHLPQAGGVLDQSAWFIEVWNALTNEQNRIDAERIKGW
jgi:hypothetical protein